VIGTADDTGTTRSTVAVVINTYNQTRFLRTAIESALTQTHSPDEILIVDDGSSDDPERVVALYPRIRLIRQANRGLSAARNRGLTEVTAAKLIFLDADDALLPGAVAAGLACFANATNCGFVYGGHRRVTIGDHGGTSEYYTPIGTSPYRDFLKGNMIGMHAAVMYDRAKLLSTGGFDPALRRCEDYDLYLRMSRSFPIASHPTIVAEYRWHGANMSADHAEMLGWALRVHRQQASFALTEDATADEWRSGRRRWRSFYVRQMINDTKTRWTHRHSMAVLARDIHGALAAAPGETMKQLLGSVARRGSSRLAEAFRALRPRRRSPRVGAVDLGELDRATPVSTDFGFDRGTPIDRHYIEQFLQSRAGYVAGHVLEMMDDTYCRRFGGSRIVQQDILDLSGDNPSATIVGDICDPRTLPANRYDCMVMTQMLQFIFDVRAAVAQMHRALKPGGVVLLTVPGVSAIEASPSRRGSWCWSLTSVAAHRLFSDVFGADNVEVRARGNVYAATTFLHGLALEEVDKARLDIDDPSYAVIVTVCARKS
jgi:glycosyltransferase involved in cell wall biosynthesis